MSGAKKSTATINLPQKNQSHWTGGPPVVFLLP